MNDSDADLDSKQVNKAIAYASRLLGSREYSVKSIYRKLIGKGYSKAESDQVVLFLLDNNWLSDQRFCESFVRSKVNRGLGKQRIEYELVQHGVDNSIIESVFAESEIDWQTTCNRVATKKEATLRESEKKARELKLSRFLRYRGFSSEQIYRAIKFSLTTLGDNSGDYDQQ